MEVRGRGLEAGDAALAIRADIPPRARVKGRERIVAEARPHLGLPAAVEVFDGGLESALLRRHKDWGDVEAQARPHDTAQDILPVVAALEDGVAVELRLGRPNSRQCSTNASAAVFAVTSGCGQESGNPPCRDTTLRTSRRIPPTRALDNVEAVEFGSPRRYLGKVPPPRRRRATDPVPGVESSTSLEDAPDRSHRRYQAVVSSQEFVVDGPGPVLTEIARLLQLASQAEHEILYSRRGAMDPRRDRRTIAPIDPVEGQLPGTAAPPLHGGKAHVVRPRYRPHRYAGPDLSDDRASLLLPAPVCFLPIPSHSHGFSPRIIE